MESFHLERSNWKYCTNSHFRHLN